MAMSDYNNDVIEQKLAFINDYYPYWHHGHVIKDLKELSFGKCNGCKGSCCKKNSCYYLASDFGGNLNDQDYVRLILNGGLVSVSRSYFYRFSEKSDFLLLRPRHVLEKDKVIGKRIPLIRNLCIFLGQDGCILPRELRPTDGLIYKCKPKEKLLVYEIEKSWEPYQDTLKDMYEEYQDKHIPLPNVSEEKVKEFQKVIMMPHY